jgi:hypothetical protein
VRAVPSGSAPNDTSNAALGLLSDPPLIFPLPPQVFLADQLLDLIPIVGQALVLGLPDQHSRRVGLEGLASH